MIADEELELLRYKGEGADLDFKQAQYPFSGATDHQKSELLKDVLAMANAYRAGSGYILIGFKDQAPHPAEVVGIAPSDHIDDASLQQFVGSKVDPSLTFHYEERMFAGKHVAVITVPKQARPFALTADFGKLRRNTVYVRRGSSTDEASMAEMSKMAIADAIPSRTVQVQLHLDSDDNRPLAAHHELAFLHFGELPDYEENRSMNLGGGFSMPMPSMRMVNSDYYRDGADYYTTEARKLLVRLSLTNHSEFALSDAKVEISCLAADGQGVRMLRADNLPDEPESGALAYVRHIPGGAGRQQVSVDDRASVPVCNLVFGTLRPGETGRVDADVALLPSGPGDHRIQVRILAKEIAPPIVQEHVITIEGPVRTLSLDDLLGLLYAKHFEPDE